jgi:hypothetical protein
MNKRLAKVLLATMSLAFTAFVFMNTYEVVFNKDIVIADSIRKVAMQDQINTVIDQFNIKPEEGRQSNNAEYSKLQYIQIPALNSNLYLEEKRNIKGTWYARPNLGHIVGLNKDNNGVIVDYMIYAVSSWQTLSSPNQIEVGMDVKLLHDGHKLSMFKVDEKKVLPLQSSFVAGKTKNRQIVLLIEDPKNGVYYGFSLVQKD